jgi:hypothetical protein
MDDVTTIRVKCDGKRVDRNGVEYSLHARGKVATVGTFTRNGIGGWDRVDPRPGGRPARRTVTMYLDGGGGALRRRDRIDLTCNLCNLCGRRSKVEVRADRLNGLLDRLAEAGRAETTLRALGDSV